MPYLPAVEMLCIQLPHIDLESVNLRDVNR